MTGSGAPEEFGAGRAAEPALSDVVRALASGPLSSKTQINAAIGALTSYRVGGRARALVRLDNRAELAELCRVLKDSPDGADTPVVVLGRGTNLLVSDEGFAGVVVMLGTSFAQISIDGVTVVAGGAAKLPVVARASVNAGLSGFEWAVGVPGSVGGAVRMNAGGHGADIKDSLVSAELCDLRSGEVTIRSNDDLDFRYRASSVNAAEIVLQARFELSRGPTEDGRAKLAEIVAWRRANQPGGQNAGSVFTNPDGDSAGRLIDSVGAKGLRIGTAEVSQKHANFIQADERGRAADVLSLMSEIQRRVSNRHGVELTFETHLLGFQQGTGFQQCTADTDTAADGDVRR